MGDLYLNSGKMHQSLLKMAANRMNLAQHQCRGLKDIATSYTWASADMRVFKAPGDEYFVDNMWRALPPESIAKTGTHVRLFLLYFAARQL
jgi:hypothetical protein